MRSLNNPAIILAALLQVLPVCRTFITNPATTSTFAIILRWTVGAAAAAGAVDAVSGATSVFTSPSTFSGSTGTSFSNKVVVSIGGGNTAASSDYFFLSAGSVTSSLLSNGQATTATLPPGLTFMASWVNGASTIGGIIYGTPTTAGSYSTTVTVVSPGNASLSQAITITISGATTPTAPAITSQPTNANAPPGAAARFSVGASGTAPLNYHWFKNNSALAGGVNISGTTSNVLTISNISTSDSGTYFVVVSNSVGIATSSNATLTVLVPPAITSQPSPQTQAVGDTATFSVAASGTAPLNYFWLKNGAAIANGTKYSGVNSSNLTVTTLATTDAGNYSVVVSNLAGTVTSSAAALIVVSSPTITSPPANVSVAAGGNASFTVTATGSAPLTYQWRKNGTPLADGGNISGSATVTLNLSAVSAGDAASYSVAVSNSLGGVISPAATLTVAISPAIVTPPASATVLASSNVSFTVSASGTAPLSYQWFKNGVAIAGATSATFSLANVSVADAANYTATVTNAVGSATSAAATLTVLVSPAITSQPTSATVVQGNPAMLIVAASGTAPLHFQWLDNGVIIPGATSNVLTLSATTTNDAGNYSAIVTNIVGSIASSSAVLTVLVPPAIVTQPADVSVVAGDTATFTVSASGSAPLTYQWRKNGAAIAGATSATLTLANVTTADAASYSVVVANTAGNVKSGNATLTVHSPPGIVTQPSNQFGAPGSNVVLSVTANGTGPLTYQWFNSGSGALTDGRNISGSTSNILTIISLTTNEVGSYFVVVSNAFGIVTSISASVAINASPIITSQPASQFAALGSNAVFTVAATGSSPFSYQWLKNGLRLVNSPTISGATSNSLTLLKVAAPASASYSVVVMNTYGNTTSAAAKLTVLNPPTITSSLRITPAAYVTTPLASGLARVGTNITFTLTATGGAPLSYQWFKDGAALSNGGNISGSTTNILEISALTTNDSGVYSVAVSNPVGLVTRSLNLTVVTPPVIVSPPASQSVVVSNAVSFSVSNNGTAPFGYRWYLGSKVIPGATNSTFSIASVTTNNGGAYRVVITNFAGSATSAVATLTVWVPPAFTAQATNRTARSGSTTVFRAAVRGATPFTFQWSRNGVALTDGGNISGSLSNVLTVANLTTNDSGAYALVVGNVAGKIVSSNATLFVRGRSSGGGNDGGGGTDNLRTLNGLTNTATIQSPAVIAQIVRNANASITLNGNGKPGSNYVVQASTNLAGWTDISTNAADAGGQWRMTDTDAVHYPFRYYRVR